MSVQQIKTIGCSTPLFKDVVLRNEYIHNDLYSDTEIPFKTYSYFNTFRDKGQTPIRTECLAKYLVHYHHSKDSYLILKHLDITDVNSMDDAWWWLYHIRILIIHDFNDSHIRKAKYFSIDNTFKKISSDWYQPSL